MEGSKLKIYSLLSNLPIRPHHRFKIFLSKVIYLRFLYNNYRKKKGLIHRFYFSLSHNLSSIYSFL